MNTLKIINNNVHGKTAGVSENYFTAYDYAIRVQSDDNTSYETNPPKIIINGNFVDGNFTGAIRSINNSTINDNKVGGTFTDNAIYCLQDSIIEGNKINAACKVGIYTTINSNIVNNNISGITDYGIRAAGKNISGNIISRENGEDIIAFIAGGTYNGSQNYNQQTLVVDNVFSHNTVDGTDNQLVKRATNWTVERNLPDYKISTPVINIRSVNSTEELAALTGMQHNEVALVAGSFEDAENRNYGFGLWRFVNNSTRDESTESESPLTTKDSIAIIKSTDNSGSWFWIDYSRLNTRMGIARLNSFANLELSASTIPQIQVNPDASVEVYGSVNVKSGGSINVESGAELNINDGATLNVSTYGSIAKTFTLSDNNDLIIKPGEDTWADQYVIDNKSTGPSNMGSVALKCGGIDRKYAGSKIKFVYKTYGHGVLFHLYSYDSDGDRQNESIIVKRNTEVQDDTWPAINDSAIAKYNWCEFTLLDFETKLAWVMTSYMPGDYTTD